MDKKIKLNLPCWICNKELFLGEGIVNYPIESYKSPAHLSCMKAQALADVMKIIDEDIKQGHNKGLSKYSKRICMTCKTLRKLKTKLQETK